MTGAPPVRPPDPGEPLTRFLQHPYKPPAAAATAHPLEEIAGLVDRGVIRPIVSHVLPLQAASEAHAQSETRRTRGKIVLQVVP